MAGIEKSWPNIVINNEQEMTHRTDYYKMELVPKYVANVLPVRNRQLTLPIEKGAFLPQINPNT
jgi:hypothetical protein